MEELKELVLEFKIKPNVEPTEEVKTKLKTFVEKYNSIVSSLKSEEIDMNEFRPLQFKVKTLITVAKMEGIDLPNMVTL